MHYNTVVESKGKGKLMKYGPKKDRSAFTRLQRFEHRQNQIQQRMQGTGRYKFKNNTTGDLGLPKPAEDGRRGIPKDGTFIGDSYFLSMVPTVLSIVEDLTVKNEPSKLITEQPPVVTNEGTVEYVQAQKKQKLNETKDKQPEVLLIEDPVGGIVIAE
jgi:hypothetical protein